MKNTTKRLFLLMLVQISRCANKNIEGFIIGGDFAEIEMYPHSVFLQATCLAHSWSCGSSILNQRILLTAAHCVARCNVKFDQKSIIIAYAGNSIIKEMPVKRKIIDLRVHPRFTLSTFTNDIAVAMLKRDLPLGQNIKRVIIPNNFPNDAYTSAVYLAGWGMNSDNPKVILSEKLKHVYQNIKAKDSCNMEMGRLYEDTFCAKSTKISGRPAMGDSGSALVTASRHHQIGLVSYFNTDYPLLFAYTNVTYYFKWIRHSARLLYCSNRYIEENTLAI